MSATSANSSWLSTETPHPERPVLIAGLGSVALLNGAGELSYVRECRGAPIDWGGIYAQSVRLTGPWTVRVVAGSSVTELGRETLRSLSHGRGGLESDHRIGELAVSDEVRVPLDGHAVCRTITVQNPTAGDIPVAIDLGFEPFLAPVAIEGVRPREYRAQREGETWHVRSFGFALSLEMDPPATSATSAGTPWEGEPRRGDVGPLSFRWQGSVPPGERREFHLRVSGGLLAPTLARKRRPVTDEERCGPVEAAFEAWTDSTPELEFPDSPSLEEGYRLARAALHTLYAAPDETITGLVAGYPWYPAVWGRDLAWMLPAVVWMGDHAWTERSLRTVFRFQAHASIPVLGARPGEIPMQVAPGPVFLYGTSDTTLYYPGLVRRLADHTGSIEFARSVFPNLRETIEWGLAKSTGPLGLLAHGDEIAAMRRQTEVGKVRVGFDAVDTTIWDSTDRRAHAIDIQVLWLEALEAIGALAAATGAPVPPGVEARAEAVRRAIVTRYAWPAERYLYDTLLADGTPVPKLRPNALRAIRTGLLPESDGRALVRRAAEPDLSTAWGVRTLSDRDPGYDPIAYHDGEVWTIATAWAADAALRAGELDLGVGYLETNARRLLEEGGYAAECYRGDRPEPFDSCFLLGFSVAPFLTTLFESLWGITPRMGERTVELRPRFPSGWRSARLRGLKLGSGALDLAYRPGSVEARWSGPGPLTLRGSASRVALEAGGTGTLTLPTLSG